jgi:fatty-acyl-CoA synthase
VAFLERCAEAFASKLAIIDGGRVWTYGEFGDRVHRLVGVLRTAAIKPGDRVAALCTNSHVMLEVHNGVPGAGAVLVPMNIRLSPGEMTRIIEHSGASLLVADAGLIPLAATLGERTGIRVVLADGPESEYERLLASATPERLFAVEEGSLLAINYTSGSTGWPKGVMYSHRGAYLQALAMAYHLALGLDSSYLWTLPMFHCDGWCHTWAVTAAGATHVCLRAVEAANIWEILSSGSITHLAGAPTVLAMVADAAARSVAPLPPRTVSAATGGAPPTPELINRLRALNISVTHLYGLTETYGPAVVNQWQPKWSNESAEQQTARIARQGIRNVVTAGVRVVDADGREVPADGTTIGEIRVCGNNVMLGYYRDEKATSEAMADGWLRTGDLAVRHPDGYLEMVDRAKDIVITGGENVSSSEIERLICGHPAVLEAAVVARPDERWGEVPVAFVTLRTGASAEAAEIIDFVRARAAHFKAPKEVIFGELPKTATGKIQKYVLRASLKTEGTEG